MLLKAKLLAIGAAAFAILLATLKIMIGQRNEAREQVKIAKKKIQFDSDVEELDSEIDQTFSRRVEEAKEAIENDKIPDHLISRR